MVASLSTKGESVTILQLSNFLMAQQFICADDFPVDAAQLAQVALLSRRGGRPASVRDGGAVLVEAKDEANDDSLLLGVKFVAIMVMLPCTVFSGMVRLHLRRRMWRSLMILSPLRSLTIGFRTLELRIM